MQASAILQVITTRCQAIEIKNNRTLKYLYLAGVFFYWMSLYLYLPTLGLYAQSLLDDWALVGAVLSMYGLWQATLRIPLGMIAGRVTHIKPLVLISLGLAGAGALTLGLATDGAGLFLGRALTGIGATAWILLVALFSSLYTPKEAAQASARLTLMTTLAFGLAPFGAALFNALGDYPLAGFVSAGISFLLLLALLPAREAPRPVSAAPAAITLPHIGALLGRRNFLFPALLSALAQFTTWASVFGFLPLLAQRMDATDVFQAILVSTYSIAFLGGNLCASFALRRFRQMVLVYVSFIFLAVGVLLGSFAVSIEMILAAGIVIGLSSGLSYPVLMSLCVESAAESEQTTAVALHQTIHALGMFAGPFVGGILAAAFGIQPMLAVIGFICLLLGLLGAYWLAASRPAHARAQ